MLNFHSDRFYKLVATSYPVDTTDELRISWKVKLTREGCLDKDLTVVYSRRKSILWKVHLKAMIQPLQALGLANVCEGDLVDDIDTTQIA